MWAIYRGKRDCAERRKKRKSSSNAPLRIQWCKSIYFSLNYSSSRACKYPKTRVATNWLTSITGPIFPACNDGFLVCSLLGSCYWSCNYSLGSTQTAGSVFHLTWSACRLSEPLCNEMLWFSVFTWTLIILRLFVAVIRKRTMHYFRVKCYTGYAHKCVFASYEYIFSNRK